MLPAELEFELRDAVGGVAIVTVYTPPVGSTIIWAPSVSPQRVTFGGPSAEMERV